MPYGSICYTYHQLKYSSPRLTAKKNPRVHGDLGKKRSGEWTRNGDRTRQKNKRGEIEMWDQTVRFQTGGDITISSLPGGQVESTVDSVYSPTFGTWGVGGL